MLAVVGFVRSYINNKTLNIIHFHRILLQRLLTSMDLIKASISVTGSMGRVVLVLNSVLFDY